MKKIVLVFVVLLLVCGSAIAGGGLTVFLDNLNVQAQADLPGFSARISAQFGVPLPQVQTVLGTVAVPADAFMVFQLGQMANRTPDAVLATYRANRGRGWGVIAKNLGIKPGSAEFHALKRGDLVLAGGPNVGPGAGKSKGKSKGKGRNK
ncbi:MAG: hypothetical protein PHO83_00050 [Geobacteraceae bacterium]|nr:hypothetical protein [Geobacteraceae bacterium]